MLSMMTSMKEKTWIEKNPWAAPVGIFVLFYLGFLYSPAVRAGVDGVFANPTQEALLIGLILFVAFFWYRGRRSARNE